MSDGVSAHLSYGASGADAVAAIEQAARAGGMQPIRYIAPLLADHQISNPWSWLTQLGQASQPKRATIARINALLAGEPIPERPRYAITRKAVAANFNRVVDLRDPPMPDAPRMDREPCWRCGVRGDVGCAHRVARWGEAA